MRSAIAPLLIAGLLLGGCEDGKPVTAPPAPESPPAAKPAAEPPASPAPAAAENPTPPETPAAPAAPGVHGATGVGSDAPVAERQSPKDAGVPPAPTEWGQPGTVRPADQQGRTRDGGVRPPPGVGR
jgi:hypothetical protein